MKTDYKILWIDDELRHVRGDKRRITNFLEDYGIELIVHEIEVSYNNCPTTDENFKKTVSDPELDMAFIDFNMPEQGQDIINFIRQERHHYHLPILFYTGEDEPQRVLQQSIRDINEDKKNLLDISDGIYFCDRDHIFDKAKLILTSLLKKEAKPQQGRGLLMDRVSEIDSKMLASITALWKLIPADKQARVSESIVKKIKKTSEIAKTNLTSIEGKNFDEILQYLQEDIRRWDTNFRAIVLRKLLNVLDAGSQEASTLLQFHNHSEDKSSLLSLRNEYAHKSVLDLANEHDDSRCKYIRTESRKHLNNLDRIIKGCEIK